MPKVVGSNPTVPTMKQKHINVSSGVLNTYGVDFYCYGTGILKCYNCKLRFRCYTENWTVNVIDKDLLIHLSKVAWNYRRKVFDSWRDVSIIPL